MAKKILEQENDKLRNIISVYIKAADFNHSVWGILKDDEAPVKAEGGNMNDKVSTTNDETTTKPQNEQGFRRKDIVDRGKNNVKILNRLDVELNEILSTLLKEKNRQRLLMNDLIKLVSKNTDMFTQAADADTNHPSEKGVRRPRHSSVQAGALNKTVGGNYEDGGIDMAVQVDEKDANGLALERAEDYRVVDALHFGVAPLVPVQVSKPGVEVPYLLRRCMTSFPMVLRVPPALWTYQMILSIYFDKIQDDDEMIKKGLKRSTMCEYIHQYFVKTMGLVSAADAQVALLLKACEAHNRRQSRIALFCSQIGFVRKEEAPPMDIRDTDFVLQIIRLLLDQGELQSDAQRAYKAKVLVHSGVFIRPDISRTVALNTVQQLFEKWLPDGGDDYLIKVRSMQHSEQGQKFVVR